MTKAEQKRMRDVAIRFQKIAAGQTKAAALHLAKDKIFLAQEAQINAAYSAWIARGALLALVLGERPVQERPVYLWGPQGSQPCWDY